MSEPRTVDEARRDIKKYRTMRKTLKTKLKHFQEAMALFENGVKEVDIRIAELRAWIKEQESV